MRQLAGERAQWAREQFGQVRIGDSRRTTRLVRMATHASQRPSGQISEVFTTGPEREGAYDLLESGHVNAAALMQSLAEVTVRQLGAESFAFVAVDGSSLSLSDHGKNKDFGSVGALKEGGRGLKVISALGVSPQGLPLGLLAQVWWARTNARTHCSRKEKQRRNRKREVQEKETRHWLTAIIQASTQAKSAGTKLWFQLDREADNRTILLSLAESGHRFTVRSSWDRLIQTSGEDKQYLRPWLSQRAPGGQFLLTVTAGPNRTARCAHMVMRWTPVVLRLRDKRSKRECRLELTAVWAREQDTCPAGEKPLDWLLLTSTEVKTFLDAQCVIRGYTQRWRIEEFHKSWKSGACNVEQTQLRTLQAVTVWATILAAVAVRIERLKILSRTEPEQPASVELTDHEIRALILLKRENKKRTEHIPDTTPTIAQATLWIAELGGYTGKSSGGPPGAITIRRGLDYLRPAARLLEVIEQKDK